MLEYDRIKEYGKKAFEYGDRFLQMLYETSISVIAGMPVMQGHNDGRRTIVTIRGNRVEVGDSKRLEKIIKKLPEEPSNGKSTRDMGQYSPRVE